MDQPDQPVVVESIGSSAPTLAAMAAEGSAPIVLASKTDTSGPAKMLLDANVARPGDLVMPTAATLSQSVSIKGTGAEHVDGVEGAVDRIATELLRRLEQGPTLVIWAFDASGSLVAERERLTKQIEQVYAHINQLDTDKIAVGDTLMTMVVAFGEDRRAMLPAPTNEVPAILSAIHAVPLDTTGVESTFSTVGWIAGKWGRFKAADGSAKYQPVTIIVTDEVGDDEPQLEKAIAAASAIKMPVYVLGSPALFGRVEGRVNFTDPKTKKVHTNIPVRQGPESVMVESIRLPFWYGGDQYNNLDAGFGPYALSRLAGATGGIYFVARLGTSRLTFDPDAMREYRPDWINPDQYARGVQKNPIRNAVIQAAMITQQNLPSQPGLTFPPADTPEFKEAMEREQTTVARIEYTVNEALDPITAVSKSRDREVSPTLAGPLRPDPRPAPGDEDPLRRVPDRLRQDEARRPEVRRPQVERLAAGGDRPDPLGRQGRACRPGDARPAQTGRRGPSRHPLGGPGQTGAEGPVRLQVGRDLRPAAAEAERG